MCNLYSITKNQDAIRQLFKVTKPKMTPMWFAFDDSRPLVAFAGIWTERAGTRQKSITYGYEPRGPKHRHFKGRCRMAFQKSLRKASGKKTMARLPPFLRMSQFCSDAMKYPVTPDGRYFIVRDDWTDANKAVRRALSLSPRDPFLAVYCI